MMTNQQQQQQSTLGVRSEHAPRISPREERMDEVRKRLLEDSEMWPAPTTKPRFRS